MNGEQADNYMRSMLDSASDIVRELHDAIDNLHKTCEDNTNAGQQKFVNTLKQIDHLKQQLFTIETAIQREVDRERGSEFTSEESE